ncbi:MAG: GNAT family N-acetyltransferase [Bacteroidota bacterium]|nr:GNAT family N-acetyltransferase [Bacteroidota bacterium]MDP3145864.1 GNAT family N-acetyltransferase [Bacteroidota bacterium]MDP3558498.1 GNAT family N-acetyltransferase [Bacteroidota bacterium]
MLELNFKPFPTIETKRLVLREIIKKDVDNFFLLRSNKDAMRFIDKPLAISKDEIKTFIKYIDRKRKDNQAISWGISLKGNTDLIGTISFHSIEKENHRAELGYMLMPEYWNKGLISEAIPKVIDYGFKKMKLHSIAANINPKHKVSRKVLEKFKFKKEAYFKENHFFNGLFLDTEIYSLLKS